MKSLGDPVGPPLGTALGITPSVDCGCPCLPVWLGPQWLVVAGADHRRSEGGLKLAGTAAVNDAPYSDRYKADSLGRKSSERVGRISFA